ncbi:LPXTG cell wall anchor domain-containing protein [Streptococcus orisratti]
MSITRARLEGMIENIKNELKQLESTKANAEAKKNGAVKALAALDKPVTPSDIAPDGPFENPSDKPSGTTPVTPSEKPSVNDNTKPSQTVTADTVATQTVDAKVTTNGQVSVQAIQAAYNKVTTQKETDKVLDRRGVPTYKAATSLPTTGDKESTTFAILGMTLLSLGAIGMKKRKI